VLIVRVESAEQYLLDRHRFVGSIVFAIDARVRDECG
jgi:hypothetical protein